MNVNILVFVNVVSVLVTKTVVFCYTVTIVSTVGSSIAPIVENVVVGILYFELLWSWTKLIVHIVLHKSLAFLCSLCSDENNTVCTTSTIDGCRGSIF